jgi:opacity protein-like surface antigen
VYKKHLYTFAPDLKKTLSDDSEKINKTYFKILSKMKKILMTMVAALAAVSMNAQVYLGGGIGFSTGKDKTEVSSGNTTTSSEDKTTRFNIEPEVGFKVADNMAVGVVLGFTTSKNEPSSSTTVKSNSFNIKPYFRYSFAQWDKVSLFCDAQVGVSTGKDKTEVTNGNTTTSNEIKTNSFSIAIVPGVAYQASNKISLVAKLGDGLGYWNTKKEYPSNKTVKESRFGLGLNTLGLTFGLYFNF